MSRQRIFRIIIIGICCAVLLVVGLHFIQIPTPYEHTMKAVKLDAQGNEVGTVDISISGTAMRSLSHLGRIVAKVSPFDGISGFDIDSNDYEQHFNEEFLHHTSVVADIGSVEDIMDAITNESASLNSSSYVYYVNTSEDFDRWLIHVAVDGTEHFYYLASIDNQYTTQELLDFFKAKLP